MSYQALDFHEGEVAMHKLIQNPGTDNPTSPFLTPFAANLLSIAPLLAVGTLDEDNRPWTSIWGGEPGLSRAVAPSVIGIKAMVDRIYDPVVGTLLGVEADGEVVQSSRGKMVAALAIDLQARKRVKLFGRMMAGALSATTEGVGEVQMAVKIEQSLGNCPKYLNRKEIRPHVPEAQLMSTAVPLSEESINVISKSDLFFVSSSHHDADMDTNHRGGPPGFVRIVINDAEDCSLVWPEYSGNRLYQTLGNLHTTPKAGLVFPDFDTGDVLYLTGTTEILTGNAASSLLSRCNLAVRFIVSAARLVRNGLPFRATAGEFSPYNPPIRYLQKEQKNALTRAEQATSVRMIEKTIITPTIARFKFKIQNPTTTFDWKAGQYVALDFSEELYIGYSHMRDDDPKSLNDDFIRTFTVSSSPEEGRNDEFEITIRKVGVVTSKMFKHNLRMDMDIELKGFGGDFFLKQNGEKTGFVAGGVGITPLLAQAATFDLEKLNIFWTLRMEDIGFAVDTFERLPSLVKCTKLYVTGSVEDEVPESLGKLEQMGVRVSRRRLKGEDLLDATVGDIQRWYVCTGTAFRTQLLAWLDGKEVYYEDFNY